MTREACRLAITAQFETALAAYPSTKPKVQYPNRNLVDPSTQLLPYIGFDIVDINGSQLDLSPKPMSVQYGQLVITGYQKENAGTRDAGLLLDYFLPWFELKELGIVRTHSGFYSRSGFSKGWEGFPVTVPFWWTRIAS